MLSNTYRIGKLIPEINVFEHAVGGYAEPMLIPNSEVVPADSGGFWGPGYLTRSKWFGNSSGAKANQPTASLLKTTLVTDPFPLTLEGVHCPLGL